MKQEEIHSCDVHNWPTTGMGARLVAEMRRKHGHGGVNACVACLERARADAYLQLSATERLIDSLTKAGAP